MKPMKLLEVGQDITPYLGPDWIMQQKHDGARMIAVYKDGALTFLNGTGGLMSFSAAVKKLSELQEHLLTDIRSLGIDELTLDGEFLIEGEGGGVYHVFDVLRFVRRGVTMVVGDETLQYRHTTLNNALSALAGRGVLELAVTAYTPEEKQLMWARINEANVEGAVSKHLSSLYIEGTRSKHWLKHKLVKTADVIVTGVERTFNDRGMVTHGSAALAVNIDPSTDPKPYVNAKGKRLTPAELLALKDSAKALFRYEPRSLLPVGNASLIGKEQSIQVGSVVEIRYLYWSVDAVVQPAILKQRFDKPAEDCDMTQFPAYTRDVVTL